MHRRVQKVAVLSFIMVPEAGRKSAHPIRILGLFYSYLSGGIAQTSHNERQLTFLPFKILQDAINANLKKCSSANKSCPHALKQTCHPCFSLCLFDLQSLQLLGRGNCLKAQVCECESQLTVS